MSFLNNTTDILESLQLFQDRVYSATYRGDPRKNNGTFFDSDDYDGSHDVDDKMPLFQVIKAVQYLTSKGEFMINYDWIHSFLCRIERTVRGLPDHIERVCEPEEDDSLEELYFTQPWKYYLDESQIILTEEDFLDDDDHQIILTRHERVKKYEEELTRRKNDFELTYNGRNTFRELCKKHHSLLVEYLLHCISLHSSIPVQHHRIDNEYGKNVNYIDEKDADELSHQIFVSRTIEVPLRVPTSTICEVKLQYSTAEEQDKAVPPFIPSQNETFVQVKGFSEKVVDCLGTHRWTVILGDPGCGKTTLLRWLALQQARLIVRTDKSFIDIRQQLNKWQRLGIRFGVAKTLHTGFYIRLPILIRTSELISWLYLHPNSTVIDYIGHQTWYRARYVQDENGSFLHDFIHHGHAFLLFDGLDEVSNYNERKMIVDLIEEFAEKYIRTPAHISINDEKEVIDEWGGLGCESPKYVGGNQIIITSRSIGYYLYPIKSAMFRLFSLDLMNQNASDIFINHWLLHVPYSIKCNMSSKIDGETNRTVRKKKEIKVKELLNRTNEKILSHPMLLSMILPILYGTTQDGIKFETRIHVYDMLVQNTLDAFILTYRSDLDNETVYRLLYDMAFYIHTHCLSGLVDAFDLTRLFYTSLKDLHNQKGIRTNNECLKNHAKDFVSMLTSNSIGFIVARGLDAYGFSHLTFQEYIVALSIVKSNVADTNFVLDRLLALITNFRFREPLTLAIEWINLNWKPDCFDRFCLELLKKTFAQFPIGALFLSSVMGNLSNRPGLHILTCLFTALLAPSVDRKCFDYLVDGLIRTNTVSTLIEHLIRENTDVTRLCRFFVLSLGKYEFRSFELPNWLSKAHFVSFEVSADTSENIETTVDSIFHYICNKIGYKKFQLSNRLIDCLGATKPNIYPTIMSLLIVLCGGLHNDRDKFEALDFYKEYTPKSIEFDATRMHRSTPLSDLLLPYFTGDQILNSNERFEHLVEQFHEIILRASTDDVSRRVVDAFIALICLQGLSDLSFYKYLLHYHALPRALYRMRLALHRMRQFYRVEGSVLFRVESLPHYAEQSKLEGCQILEKFIMNSKADLPTAASFSIAMCAAYSRLFFHAYTSNVTWNQPLPIRLAENKVFFQSPQFWSAQSLHLILNPCSKDNADDAAKWTNEKHPFQIYYKHSLFPIAFISSKLQPIFQRLISIKQRKSKETMPFPILLAELLLSLDEILQRNRCEKPLKILLILRLLENDIHQYQLNSYSQAIIHDIKTEANYNDWYFSDHDRGVKPAQSENTLKEILDIERERLHEKSDFKLFAASIGLVRVAKSLANTYNSFFEEVKVAALSIVDPVLRIICLRYIREMVRSCIDTKYYYAIQSEIVHVIENISEGHTTLVILALILGACAEDHLHPSMQRLLNFIWEKLQCEPTCDEEKLDQEAIFQTIRHIIGHRQMPIPLRFLVHSSILQLNSPVFHKVFQNMAFNNTENTLLAQLYLAEVTVDAQVLAHFSQEIRPLSTKFPPVSAKNMLKFSWKPRWEKFSHKQVMLINSLVLSSFVVLEEISFSTLIQCTGFEEERDRPVVESWLDYYEDERCAQVAILAVFLLIRNEKDMAPAIHSKVEKIFTKGLSNKIDSIRRGTRACFTIASDFVIRMCYFGWSISMWCLLRDLMVSSLGRRFTLFLMSTVQNMRNLLEAERQRLRVHREHDPYFQFSLLSLIDEAGENDGSDIQAHLAEVLMVNDHMQDMYLANVIFHIVRICKQKEWCNKLLESLRHLLHNGNLPNTQIAAIYALQGQKRGRDILLAALFSHFDPTNSSMSDDRIYLSESQLVACMIALTNRHDQTRYIEPLSTPLLKIWDFAKTESIRVKRHIQACYFSHLSKENDRHLSILESSFNMTYQEIYSLYIINTSYFVLEWRKRAHWIEETAKFIVSYRHDILPQFVSDLYMYLTAGNKTIEFQNPEPNYLAVARNLTGDNSDLFCHAIRNSSFGEENFKNALYLYFKRGITVDQKDMCVELYANFQILTEHFIEMVFALCLEDFSIYQFDVTLWFKKIIIADRSNIEVVFSYIESPSIYQRQLVVGWLLRLVELDIVSFHEVQQLILEKDVWEIVVNENNKFCRTSDWYRLMCLEPLPDKVCFATVTVEEVEADYSEVADAPYLQFS